MHTIAIGMRLLRRSVPLLGVKGYCMNVLFAENLRKLREGKGLSQRQLGDLMFVNHSTIARWENGSRLPNAMMIIRLSRCLGVDPNTLLLLTAESEESPKVIMVDDSRIVLADSMAVLEEVMPESMITGFIWPQEAIEYARMNRVELAVLDIELGNSSGFDLCHTLHEINPATNVVFLTAFADYALDAWTTEADGFILKPLTPEGIREQLKRLHYPLLTGGMDE